MNVCETCTYVVAINIAVRRPAVAVTQPADADRPDLLIKRRCCRRAARHSRHVAPSRARGSTLRHWRGQLYSVRGFEDTLVLECTLSSDVGLNLTSNAVSVCSRIQQVRRRASRLEGAIADAAHINNAWEPANPIHSDTPRYFATFTQQLLKKRGSDCGRRRPISYHTINLRRSRRQTAAPAAARHRPHAAGCKRTRSTLTRHRRNFYLQSV
ncbi:hypothetical protein EVAR_102433_1 [Eumeta japonica]|uniref:Uncharacterized protein n=1 Tax=Eumeta variegata TaxID=151549 RepID=A0A4C1YZZ0_EUMVA|nr:hypothetical protein EVAR_102433_1 [Eumeta japonica]